MAVKTPLGNAPVIPLLILMSGLYLAWFGVHYWRTDTKYPSTPIQRLLQGKSQPDHTSAPSAHVVLAADVQALQPDSNTNTNNNNNNNNNTNNNSGATGSKIADDALKYKGQGYVWGGNANQPGNWDCSSFVSYVLGHDLKMPLPGGKWGDPGFPPHTHGPTTLNYLVFGQPINAKDVQPGDLIVSTEHIGIAISKTQMISAQDPALGTGVGNFPAGFPAGPPHYRRVSG